MYVNTGLQKVKNPFTLKNSLEGTNSYLRCGNRQNKTLRNSIQIRHLSAAHPILNSPK
jgi:hypothetical protein